MGLGAGSYVLDVRIPDAVERCAGVGLVDAALGADDAGFDGLRDEPRLSCVLAFGYQVEKITSVDVRNIRNRRVPTKRNIAIPPMVFSTRRLSLLIAHIPAINSGMTTMSVKDITCWYTGIAGCSLSLAVVSVWISKLRDIQLSMPRGLFP